MSTYSLNLQNNTQRDRVLLIFAIALFSVSIFYFFDLRATLGFLRLGTHKLQDGLAIGRIVSSKSDVRYRRQEDVIWNQIEQNLEIKSGDGVFTGKQSTAVVELGQEKKIELMPDSMVLFQESATDIGKQIIEVKRGGFKGRLAPNTILKIGDKMISSKDSALIDIVADKTNSEMKLTVEDGTLDLEDPLGKSIVIQKAETISVSDKKSSHVILKTPFDLLSPAQGEIAVLGNKIRQIKLEWHSHSGGKKVKIFLSQSPSFDSTTITYNTTENSFQVQGLKDGQWYWKLANVQNQEGYSQESVIHSFEVAQLPVPVLISPYENKSFSVLESQMPAEISVTPITKKLNHTQKIEVTILKSNTIDPAINYHVDVSELKHVRISEPGSYAVKIRNILDGQHSSWSNEIKLNVALTPTQLVQVPTEVIPQDTLIQEAAEEVLPKPLVFDWKENKISKAVVYLLPVQIEPILISWSKESGYKYKLQISNNPEFEKPLVDRYIDIPEYSFLPKLPGKYFARIRAEKTATQFTNWYVYSTIHAKPVYSLEATNYIAPKTKQVIIEGMPTTFSWVNVPDVEKYFVIIKSVGSLGQERVIVSSKSEIQEYISPDRKYNWSVYYSDNGNINNRKIAATNIDLLKAEQTSVLKEQEFVTYLKRNRFTTSFNFISGMLTQTGSATLKPSSSITGTNIDLAYRRKMERENWFTGFRLSATQYKSSAQSSFTLTGEGFAEKQIEMYSLRGKVGAGLGSLTHPVVDISSRETVYAISDFYFNQYVSLNYEFSSKSTIEAELKAQERIDNPGNSYFVSPRIGYFYNTNRGVFGTTYAYKTFNNLINLSSGKVPGYQGTLGSSYQESNLGFSYQFSY